MLGSKPLLFDYRAVSGPGSTDCVNRNGLVQHFPSILVRMGQVQPRSNQVSCSYFEFFYYPWRPVLL